MSERKFHRDFLPNMPTYQFGVYERDAKPPDDLCLETLGRSTGMVKAMESGIKLDASSDGLKGRVDEGMWLRVSHSPHLSPSPPPAATQPRLATGTHTTL